MRICPLNEKLFFEEHVSTILFGRIRRNIGPNLCMKIIAEISNKCSYRRPTNTRDLTSYIKYLN
jgi:hypothetical protein